MLFLYAKLNPGQGYVQVGVLLRSFQNKNSLTWCLKGMNEIIGPIYYVMASDPRAVAFFVFA